MNYRILASCLAAALLVFGVQVAYARPTDNAAPQLGSISTNAFIYQGWLSDNGHPTSGDYDFRVALYDSASGGSLIANFIDKPNTPVKDGLFNLDLDFGSDAFDVYPYLQVCVRPAGSMDAYTWLMPRQKISSVPFANRASGIKAPLILSNGTDPATNSVLAVAANDASYAIRVTSENGDAVEAYSMGGYGVRGISNSNTGVSGSGNQGVYGAGVNSDGLHGYSKNGFGLFATSDNNKAGYFVGDVEVTGKITSTNVTLQVADPRSPQTQVLNQAQVASDQMLDIYSGQVSLDANGSAVVDLPSWFETLNGDFTYQLTPLGAPAPGLYVADEIQDHRFSIAGGAPGIKVSWLITGVRQASSADSAGFKVEQSLADAEKGGQP
jgi:hypothetical protein